MIRKLFIATVLIFQLFSQCLAQAEYPFGTIMKKVFDDEVIKSSSNSTKARAYMKSLQANGAWTDIEYFATDITEWRPMTHLDRLKVLISAYVFDKSTLYQNAALKKSIDAALNYWCENEFASSNWWHNDIAVPKALGVSLILMKFGKEKVHHDLEYKLVFKMIQGDPYVKTGANKSDIAMHYFYRALITEDKNLLVSSLQQLFYPIQLVNDAEGLQYDFSYLQHGPQLYIAGYGEEFMKGISKVMAYVRGTPYAVSKEKLQLFSSFITDTYLPIIRAKYIDFNVHGRGVSRPGILNKTSETNILKQMTLIEPEKAKVWQEGIEKMDSLVKYNTYTNHRHTHFWKADYSIHLRKKYHFNVRLASNRTNKSEAGNRENIYGKHMTDGVTNIQVYGPEYYNIFPIWEWDKIPGTTTQDRAGDDPLVEQWGVPAKNNFAGGVSSQEYGVSAMKVDYDSVQANKAWFFFDNQIVCLGSNINSSSDNPITTTLNQSWFQNKVLLDTKTLGKGDSISSSNTNSVIIHDDVIYFLPEQQNLTVTTKEQAGSWYKINEARSKERITGNVFKAWIDHGVRPKNATYAYVVYPGTSKYSPTESKMINVLANTEHLQAVSHQGLGIVQMVVYYPGTYEVADVKLTVDKPAIIQLIKKDNTYELAIVDPLQIPNNKIQVNLETKGNAKKHTLLVDMPTGTHCGSTKVIEL